MNTIIKYTYGFRNPLLEKEITEKLNEVRHEAEQDATFAAKKSKPLRAIIFAIWSNAKEIASSVSTHFDPEINKLHTQIKGCDIETLKKEGAIQLKELNDQISLAERELRKYKLDLNPIKRKLIYVGVAACLLLESILNFRAWQVLTENLFTSIIVALLTAVSMAIGIHQFSIMAVNAKTIEKRNLWIAVSLGGAALAFFLLGLLRREFYGSDNSILTSPILWMLWNMFFYSIAFLLTLNNTLTKDQKVAYLEFEQKFNEKNELETKVKTINDEIEKEGNKLKKWKEELSLIEKYQEKLLIQIDMGRNEICAECIKEYELQGGNISFSQIINDLKKQTI